MANVVNRGLDRLDKMTITARECHMSYGQLQAYRYTHGGNDPQKTPKYLEDKEIQENKSVEIG